MRGFTIIETVVTIGIFATLSIGVTLLVRDVFMHSRQQTIALSNIDQARTVASRFVNELRNANYGSDGSYALNTAGAQEIVFFTTYPNRENPVRIRYYLSGTDLYKGVTTPTGTPLTYNTQNEVISLVQKDVQNGTNPIFYYYDGDYTGSTPALSQPVNVNYPTYITINLDILTQDDRGASTTFTVSTGALIRSLKTNLDD